MKKSFYINKHLLGEDPCYIIAEIGSNHDKDKNRAIKMIESLAKMDINAVKFQLFKADRLASKINLPETCLTDKFSKFGTTMYDLYQKMELPDEWLQDLKDCCTQNHIDFLVTPFDEESADQLAQMNVPAFKVASFEITHIPFLQYLATLKKPILLSTGMANLEEISKAIKTIQDQGEDRIALFHCGIEYPAPFEAVHLRCIETLYKTFDCPVGYSDHTQGGVVSVAAVALGAKIFEKHVSLEKGDSPDHDFALSLDEFAEMVKMIRQCEAALGTSQKVVQKSEEKYLRRGRRSVFLIQDIREGEIFSRDNLAVLRPGVGLAPERVLDIFGKKAIKDLSAPALLQEGDWY